MKSRVVISQRGSERELTAKRIELGTKQVVRSSDDRVLWKPDCHSLCEARSGTIQARSVAAKVEPAQAVACVSVDGAQAYYQARGRRLPSKAEWELAAGGVAKHWLPWDDTVSCDDAVFACGDDGRCNHLLNRPQVTSATDRDFAPEGVRTLAGNVSEWASSESLGESAIFVARGGNWGGLAVSMRPTKRLRVAFPCVLENGCASHVCSLPAHVTDPDFLRRTEERTSD